MHRGADLVFFFVFFLLLCMQREINNFRFLKWFSIFDFRFYWLCLYLFFWLRKIKKLNQYWFERTHHCVLDEHDCRSIFEIVFWNDSKYKRKEKISTLILENTQKSENIHQTNTTLETTWNSRNRKTQTSININWKDKQEQSKRWNKENEIPILGLFLYPIHW